MLIRPNFFDLGAYSRPLYSLSSSLALISYPLLEFCLSEALHLLFSFSAQTGPEGEIGRNLDRTRIGAEIKMGELISWDRQLAASGELNGRDDIHDYGVNERLCVRHRIL